MRRTRGVGRGAMVAVPLAVVLLATVFAGRAFAQSAGGANEGLMDAAVHLIKVGRFDEAAAMLKQIVATNPTPAEALRLRDRAGYAFLAPLIDHPKLGPPVRELLRLAYEAVKANRRNPRFIREMIALLTTREAPRAERHLRMCGPYAVPYLLEVLRDPRQATHHQAVRVLLTRMPEDAAPAMVEGLNCPDPEVQAAFADALGQMRSRLALHQLKRLAETPGLPTTVSVPVQAALRAVLGPRAWSAKRAVEYYLELSLALQREEKWAMPLGHSENVPLWTWNEAEGKLKAVEVPRYLYGPLAAERAVLRLLNQWPGYEPAYPVWYLAKLGKLRAAREHPDSGLKPEEVADEVRLLAAVLGEKRLMAGCRMALERPDYRAAQGFLEGLERVVNPRAVRVDPTVVKALTAPDRAVRYQAALVLVAADPREPFPGSELAVPVLAEALSQVSQREVVVAATDLQLANRLRTALREGGYTVRDVQSARKALEWVADSPGVEAVIFQAGLSDPPVDTCLREIRSARSTREMPVVLVAASDLEETGLTTGVLLRYSHVSVIRATASGEAVRRHLARVLLKARGRPLEKAEAQSFSRRAAAALAGIEPNHPVFHLQVVAARARTLLEGEGPEALKVAACRILARVGDAASQQALLRAALAGNNPPAVVEAALEGLLAAIRRKGSAIGDKEAQALPALFDRGDPKVTDLVARLLGIRGVPAEKIPDLYRRAKAPPVSAAR